MNLAKAKFISPTSESCVWVLPLLATQPSESVIFITQHYLLLYYLAQWLIINAKQKLLLLVAVVLVLLLSSLLVLSTISGRCKCRTACKCSDSVRFFPVGLDFAILFQIIVTVKFIYKL